MKTYSIKRFIVAALGVLMGAQSYAQVNFALDLQNMHLWRGMEVADGVVLTSDLSLTDRQKRFCIGLWGGVNTQGTYKEFNYYASYTYKGLKLSLWDIYNFSPGADYNNREVFNYQARETGRFLDATASYQWNGKFPLFLSWSTVVFGRDRDRLNEKNRYSTFVYAEYPLWQKERWDIRAGVGGAFALSPEKDETGKTVQRNFYGDTVGIVHVNLKAVYQFRIAQVRLPLTLLAMWNPQSNKAYFQAGVRLLEF